MAAGLVGSGGWNGRGLPFLQRSGLFHMEQIQTSGGAAAAGFEFFAGAAGAGVVAADFGEFALEGEFELGRGRLVGSGGGGLTGRRVERQRTWLGLARGTAEDCGFYNAAFWAERVERR